MEYLDTGLGVNTFSNVLARDGALIHSVNMTSPGYGFKVKRTGYTTFLGTPDTSQVQSLHAFPNIGNDSTKVNLIRASGSALYSSVQGTGDWTLMGNGTISAGAHFGQAILDNVMIGGDGVGSTRHTTNGTSWTDTTLAPPAEFFEQYQNRIYAAGTASTLFYSTTNDATNWNTSGTSDSSSLEIPGEGKLGMLLKATDRLISTKSTGLMYRWDGFSLFDMATKYGPSSPYSIAESEDYKFFINQYGHFGFGGVRPQLLSNAVQRQFYNDANTGIAGTVFPLAPAEVHKYDYLVSVGDIEDDFTDRPIPNAIIKYDYQKNEYLNWSFANKPTSFLSYNDKDGVRQLIFGDASGQCYKMDNTVTTDNGQSIPCEMVYVFHYGVPKFKKKWNYWRGFFNPGCEAKVQVAFSDVYSYENLNFVDLGDCSNGMVECKFQQTTMGNPVSRFLFVRIYENSKNSRMVFLGQDIDAIPQEVS